MVGDIDILRIAVLSDHHSMRSALPIPAPPFDVPPIRIEDHDSVLAVGVHKNPAMRVDDDGAMRITEADSVRQPCPVANPFVAVFTVTEQYLLFSADSAPPAEEACESGR